MGVGLVGGGRGGCERRIEGNFCENSKKTFGGVVGVGSGGGEGLMWSMGNVNQE